MFAAAENLDPKKKQGQVCGANFFSGELALLDGSKQEAARLFRIAADGGPENFIEWAAANAELKALDAGEPPCANKINLLFYLGRQEGGRRPARPRLMRSRPGLNGSFLKRA